MTEADAVTDGDTSPSGSDGTFLFFALLAAALLIPLAAIAAWYLISGAGSDGRTRTYVVEPGTADRIASGERVRVMPAELRLHVGDTLVIKNRDRTSAVVGPYTVGAGLTFTQTFQRAQVLVGECSLSPTGQVRIVVT